MRKIIDFHNHIYPDKIAKRAVQGIRDFYNLNMELNGSIDDLLNNGDKAGIHQFLVHSVATKPEQVASINNFIANECNLHPDRFIGFGAMHPDLDNIEEEIERIISMGMHGVKLHPDFQMFNIDDKKAYKIYELCQGRLPILIHMGDYRFDYSHPRRLVPVMNEFKELTVIAAHMGGWSLWKEAEEYMMQCDCYMDTSSTFEFLPRSEIRRLITKYGADRIVFGSDFPMWKAQDEMHYLDSIGLTEDELDKIYYKTAESILGIE